MSNLIGGFTIEQYKAYTNPSINKQTSNQSTSRKVNGFSCFSFKGLAVLINRIGFFILSRLSIYPNNNYLFQKFKSHDFQKIINIDELKNATEINSIFERCQEINAAERQLVEQALQSAQLRLNPSSLSLTPDNSDSEGSDVDSNEDDLSNPLSSSESDEDDNQPHTPPKSEPIQIPVNTQPHTPPTIDPIQIPVNTQPNTPPKSEPIQIPVNTQSNTPPTIDPIQIPVNTPPKSEPIQIPVNTQPHTPPTIDPNQIPDNTQPNDDPNQIPVDTQPNTPPNSDPIQDPNPIIIQPIVHHSQDLVKKGDTLAKEVKQLIVDIKNRKKAIDQLNYQHDQKMKKFAIWNRTYYDYKEAKNVQDTTLLDHLIDKATTYSQLIQEGQTLRSQGLFSIGEFDQTFTPLRGQISTLFEEAGKEFSSITTLVYPKGTVFAMDQKYQQFIKALEEADTDTLEGKSTWGGFIHQGINIIFNATKPIPEHYRWKVERYEKLIRGSQKGIEEYFKSKAIVLGNIETVMKEGKQTKQTGWQKQILPVLQFYMKNIQNGEGRLNDNYLKAVRKCYTNEFLEPLREASRWAIANPLLPGVEHIHALCYQFYATLDLNDVCKDVASTFLKEGEKSVTQKKNLAKPEYALISNLLTDHEKVHAVPNAFKSSILDSVGKSIVGHVGGTGLVPFDPIMDSNPVHVLYNKTIKTPNGVRIVSDIAMGTPTIQYQNNKVEICPIFKGYLSYLKTNSLKHLYINYQDFSTEKGFFQANESTRCQALHDLAEKGEFQGTFFVMTLTQDSVFYAQKGHEFKSLHINTCKDAIVKQLLDGKQFNNYFGREMDLNEKNNLAGLLKKILDNLEKEFKTTSALNFSDKKQRNQFVQRFHEEVQKTMLIDQPAGYSIYSSAQDFKQELIAQIFDRDQNETGNCIPQYLRGSNNELRNWGATVVGKIHFDLFGNKPNLSPKERRIFIRLFYQFLSRKVMIDTEVEKYNASCKDGIDRRVSMEREDFNLQTVVEGRSQDKEPIEFGQTMTFSRALIVRKREINKHRLEPVVVTGKFMIDNKDKLIQLHKDLFPNIEITLDVLAKPVPVNQVPNGNINV